MMTCGTLTSDNMLALGSGGAVALLITLPLVAGALCLTRHRHKVRRLLVMTPLVAMVWLAGCVFSALAYQAMGPTLGVVFGAESDTSMFFTFLLGVTLTVVGLPTFLLEWVMQGHIDVARGEQREILVEDLKENRLDAGAYNYLQQLVNSLMTEKMWMLFIRSVLVMMGVLAFGSLLRAGLTLMPSGWGLAISVVVALGVVSVALACVITCYPQLRRPVERLNAERSAQFAACRRRSVEVARARLEVLRGQRPLPFPKLS
jgi:hypothetical protein